MARATVESDVAREVSPGKIKEEKVDEDPVKTVSCARPKQFLELC
jgi:hypothetical protein